MNNKPLQCIRRVFVNDPREISSSSHLGRRQVIELLRVLAAFGIVFYHTSTVGKDVSYGGLIIFIILSVYFTTRETDEKKTLSVRAIRLLVPWLAWSFFYGLMNLYQERPFVSSNRGIFEGLLCGTSAHLWYLPFMFFFLAVIERSTPMISRRHLALISFSFSILIFLTVDFWRPWSISLGCPWAQYFHAAAAIFIGIFLGCMHSMSSELGILMLLVIVACSAWAMDQAGVGTPYIIGIIAASCAIIAPFDFPATAGLSRLADCMLGVYLSHIFLHAFMIKFGLRNELLLPIVVFGISSIFVIGLKRIFPRHAKYVV